MNNINMKGTIVEFCDLNEEAQRKLYEKQGATLAEEAIKSQYVNIRLLAIKDLSLSSEQLDKLFERELSNLEEKMIEYIYNHPNFKKTDQKRRRLLKANNFNIKKIAILDEETTSEFFNELLLEILKSGKNEYLSYWNEFRKNKNFEPVAELLRMIIKSDDISAMLNIARDKEIQSTLLNELIRERVDKQFSEIIVDEALDNTSLKLEKETVIALSKSSNWRYREIAAESEETSEEDLKKMLEKEIEGEKNSEVIEAIMNNSRLSEEDKLTIFAESSSLYFNGIAAESPKTPTEELEKMYLKENNIFLHESIVANLLSRVETTKLSFIHKHRIFLLLLKLRKKQISVVVCFKKILDIIS